MTVRILYVHNNADMYGASRSLVRLLHALNKQRFEPVVLLPLEGPLTLQLRGMGIKVLIFPQLSVITREIFHSWRLPFFVLNIPSTVLRLRRLIKLERVALVHTNSGVILSSSVAARLAGVAHVWHIREWFQEFNSFWRFHEFWISLFSDRIITVSKAIAAQFSNQAKVSVIHDGYDIEEFRLGDPQVGAVFRRRYGLDDSLIIGCVGRIKLQRKGQEVLLRAAGLLKQRGIQAKYLIVGAPFPGNEVHLEALHAMVQEYDLGADVVFTGELADPRPAYAAMDIFVLPSAQPEPFGGVVMEAMGMGLPVVATNLGGSVEQVVDGETGYLVPPSDPAALAENLKILLEDEILRKRLGEIGRHRIEKNFTLDAMVEKIVQIYDDCMTPK